MYRVRACNDGRGREREREIGFLPRVVPTLYFVIARLYCNGDDSDQDERVKEGSLTRTSIVAGTTHLPPSKAGSLLPHFGAPCILRYIHVCTRNLRRI